MADRSRRGEVVKSSGSGDEKDGVAPPNHEEQEWISGEDTGSFSFSIHRTHIREGILRHGKSSHLCSRFHLYWCQEYHLKRRRSTGS
jgi:hypothetical protein